MLVEPKFKSKYNFHWIWHPTVNFCIMHYLFSILSFYFLCSENICYLSWCLLQVWTKLWKYIKVLSLVFSAVKVCVSAVHCTKVIWWVFSVVKVFIMYPRVCLCILCVKIFVCYKFNTLSQLPHWSTQLCYQKLTKSIILNRNKSVLSIQDLMEEKT